MPKLVQITPLVSVKDIGQSVAFFVATLGFKVAYQAEEYAYLHRDNVGIRILKADEGADLQNSKRQQCCYIDVEGVNQLYDTLRPKLDKLPKGRVKKPFDQFYGQREFHVMDEDSLLIMFGEPLAQY